jgi:hypothetical protein
MEPGRSFRQTGRMTRPEKIVRVRISLKEIEPEIWRLVEVPVGMNLKGLHDVIQVVLSWEDYHLFEFLVGDRIYGVPAPDGEDYGRKVVWAKSVKIAKLIAQGVTRFDYNYDFGDNWRHLIVIEAVADSDPRQYYPRLVAGERRGPPEDCGGVPGYYEFIEAMAGRRHPEHRRMMEWYGGRFDPDDIGHSTIRPRLAAIAKHRLAGKLAAAMSRGKK